MEFIPFQHHSLPNFTKPTQQRWEKISLRRQSLANDPPFFVWWKRIINLLKEMNFNCTFCHCYATPFFEWRWKIWHYTTTSVSFLSSSSFTKKEHIERWQSPFPTVYVLAMLQQYLQAFSWLKFCSCSWEQESILMPDTSSQTTISGTRMQQHARSIKISSISLPRRFYF